ncbi:hypothetical protein ASF72_10615 [Arthrobacter sp. Leaf141]|uniref:hypothetical protein n=1 Tax=Arthrobacter sp. Leaf141 TaxID=1736273 RepID=UPI0006F6267B|nr:hypothetical protein [Arthrobacter sp. Leaf141]KQR02478.1 hypothetical protein ASF72_10615 [Arthrobacter sp. Leaf141]
MASEQIKWAGRTLSGTDRFGRWTCAAPDGWWDSPEAKGNVIDRPDADGEHDMPIYNRARLVTFDGLLHAHSHEVLHDAGIFLTGAMTGRAQVSGHGASQWADGKKVGRIRFRPLTATMATWQVPLKFVDPRKFGELREFVATPGADALAYHRGNYPAKPVATVAGSMPGGYRLGVGGLAFVITRPLLPGVPHVIDYNDGRLRINGLVVHGNITESFTPGINPGTQTVVSLTATTTGTGTASFAVYDTYI